MAYECPACNKNTITTWQNYISSPLLTVTCSNCASQVHAGGAFYTFINTIAFLSVVCFFFIIVIKQEILYIALLVLSWLFCDILRVKYSKIIISKNRWVKSPNKSVKQTD